MPDLGVRLGPLELKNPLILASGTWGFGEALSSYLDLSILGGLISKGLSKAPRPGNPPPRIAETPCGLINAIGLENPGVQVFKEKILPSIKEKTTSPLLVNVFGEKTEEFVTIIQLLAGEVEGFELNISCPNVEKGGISFSQDPQAVRDLVREVRSVYSGFLAVKLSPVGPVAQVAEAALTSGADALTVANTYPAMAVDLYRRSPALGRLSGGLSGPAIKPLTLKLVFDLWQRFRAPIMASGGIVTGKDVLEYILCGASACQIGTATLLDPENPKKILEEVQSLLVELGEEKITSLKGALRLDA